jgi:hypothetical protein
MVEVRQAILSVVVGVGLTFCYASVPSPRFYPDDPLESMPAPLPVGKIAPQKVNDTLDFLKQSTSDKGVLPVPAGAINTLGDVPDSEWFTNRHAARRMTRDELQRGFNAADLPVPPFTITGGKNEGVTPGFRMTDSRGRRYFVKVDPIDSPELATSADVIVSRFLNAIGYNTPKNDIVQLHLSDLRVSETANLSDANDRKRHMTWKDVEGLVKRIPHYPDGSFRIMASLAVEGENVGPFRYEGVRGDDPNDVVLHQDRRDLRSLYVFSAWLNNTDMRANNTLDTVVEEKGVQFIRHYLIDFGSALGSDGINPKDPRFGHRYILPTPAEAASRILTIGVFPDPWELTDFPKLRGIGNFDSQSFQPDHWKSEFPNPALMKHLPDDDFWAAKQVMAFSDDDIRAIVETARLTVSISQEYLIRTLCERRDKVGRTFFSKLLPLDDFRIENGELLFDDLSVVYGFHSPRRFQVQWSRFDNLTGRHETIADADSIHLPDQISRLASNEYFCARIVALNDPLKPVSVYFRKNGETYKLVGIDRLW